MVKNETTVRYETKIGSNKIKSTTLFIEDIQFDIRLYDTSLKNG